MLASESRSSRAAPYKVKSKDLQCFKAKDVAAVAYLPSTLFQKYIYTPPPDQDGDLCIELQLSIFLECLEIFGSNKPASSDNFKRKNGFRQPDGDDDELRPPTRDKLQKSTALQLSYTGLGDPLVLVLALTFSFAEPYSCCSRLEESGVVTRCELTTFEPDSMLDIQFDDARAVQKLIVKSKWLSDAFAELDKSCDKVTLSFHPSSKAANERTRKEAGFSLEAVGSSGSIQASSIGPQLRKPNCVPDGLSF